MSLWQNITLGRYIPADSIVHRLDPRAKLLASVVIMFTIMRAESWPALLLWTALLLAAISGTRIPLRIFLSNLRAFLWLFGITILLHALTSATAPEAEGGVVFSWHGVARGMQYALRLGLLVIVAALLSNTTIPTDLTDGLERLLRPMQRLRFPVHELALMTTMALRFVPTIVEEAQRIQRAQLARGARFAGSLRQRVQALVPMLVPLFVATFSRADELAVAMEARCYQGGEGRVSYRELAWRKRDWAALAVTAGLSLLAFHLS
ncbi:MAG: energy-coupling factor transporter transmembrane protein EcfT [candidate division KSB1 bacterium]|nr:energy-coupling factor transporter transmembrane protein EcfT [candidate division KSB1 bacterium]MDZ7275064.1 energy-coupling factor transporter transmembrane protein EcfT [candidate division KSB1 bacterium]MDZ7286488.1 energy-coupling factor transporter transmembrane protein EcfT [candidate division KSB1 bacterium]MDZ7299348.1 energy-coupling factor transporter transmembrane protein EcfT [candidate division KSB1 bacterium]MDZ7306323.1 energy-coupling factor transporter transmembrane protein